MYISIDFSFADAKSLAIHIHVRTTLSIMQEEQIVFKEVII